MKKLNNTVETTINLKIENVPGFGFVVVLHTPERDIYLNESAAINMAAALLDLSEKAEIKSKDLQDRDLNERPALRVVGGKNAVH